MWIEGTVLLSRLLWPFFQTITTGELKYYQRQGNIVYSRIILPSLLNNHRRREEEEEEEKKKKIKGGWDQTKTRSTYRSLQH